MTTALLIQPARFIASDGKLDSNNRYLFRNDLTPLFLWPKADARTSFVWGIRGDVGMTGDYPLLQIGGITVTPESPIPAPGSGGTFGITL